MKLSNGSVNLLLTSGTGYLSSQCLISQPYLAKKIKIKGFTVVVFFVFWKSMSWARAVDIISLLFSPVSPHLKTLKLLIFGDYKRERGIIAVISKHTES